MRTGKNKCFRSLFGFLNVGLLGWLPWIFATTVTGLIFYRFYKFALDLQGRAEPYADQLEKSSTSMTMIVGMPEDLWRPWLITGLLLFLAVVAIWLLWKGVMYFFRLVEHSSNKYRKQDLETVASCRMWFCCCLSSAPSDEQINGMQGEVRSPIPQMIVNRDLKSIEELLKAGSPADRTSVIWDVARAIAAFSQDFEWSKSIFPVANISDLRAKLMSLVQCLPPEDGKSLVGVELLPWGDDDFDVAIATRMLSHFGTNSSLSIISAVAGMPIGLVRQVVRGIEVDLIKEFRESSSDIEVRRTAAYLMAMGGPRYFVSSVLYGPFISAFDANDVPTTDFLWQVLRPFNSSFAIDDDTDR